MFDPATGDQRYLLSRFNAVTLGYEILDDKAFVNAAKATD